MSDSVRPHGQQPTRLCHPWDSPGKNTGVVCHFLLQCMKVKREWTWSRSVVSDSSRHHGLQPTRLLCQWDFPGKSTGVGCHCFLCMYSRVAPSFLGGVAPSYATLYDSAPWPRSTPRREALYLMYPHISKSQSFQMFQKPPGCQVKLLILDPLSQIIWCAGLEGARESPFNEYSSSLGISMQLVSGYSHGLHMVFLYEDQSLDLGSILIRYKLILKNYICKHYCK